ncbi:MAG: glycosyltransferase family 2 protein [archaeon]|jgi:glycosyltransferase involved in cell wall biosynthesis
MEPSVSAVINAYNEEETISECVLSVKNQSVKPLEIIVVDDGSTDGTAEFAERAGAKVFRINHTGRGRARNIGWKKAKGKIVAYIDADMVVNRDWIKEILKKFDAGADAVIDRIHVWKPDNAYTKSLDAFYSFRIENDYVPFSAWAYKKDLLKKIGGFKNVSIEEGELGKRFLKAGYKIVLAEKAARYHKGPPRSFFSTVKRNYLTGKNEALGIYKNHSETFPKKTVAAYIAFISTEFVSIAAAFFNPLFLIWIPVSIALLYFALVVKFVFINKAIGKVSFANCFLIGLASLIRALVWPAGIIAGYLVKE